MLGYLLALSIICSPASDKVEQAVKAYVENNYPVKTALYEFDFRRINWSIIPVDFDSVSICRIGKESPLGQTVFTLGIYEDGDLLKAIPASIGVSLLVDALITTKPLNVGEPITRLTQTKRTINSTGETPITDSSRFEGMQAKNYIPAGSVIYESMIEVRPWISPGDRVNIIIDKGAIKVSAEGIARQKGAPGELIRVVNLGSKKIIQAEVIDSVTVALR